MKAINLGPHFSGMFLFVWSLVGIRGCRSHCNNGQDFLEGLLTTGLEFGWGGFNICMDISERPTGIPHHNNNPLTPL